MVILNKYRNLTLNPKNPKFSRVFDIPQDSIGPLESGTAAETKKEFTNIMYEAKSKPRILMTDNGSEFIDAEFKKFLEKEQIKLTLKFLI